MDASTQDFLPIGGGAVGLSTAVAATERNAKLNMLSYPRSILCVATRRRTRHERGTRGLG